MVEAERVSSQNRFCLTENLFPAECFPAREDYGVLTIFPIGKAKYGMLVLIHSGIEIETHRG